MSYTVKVVPDEVLGFIPAATVIVSVTGGRTASSVIFRRTWMATSTARAMNGAERIGREYAARLAKRDSLIRQFEVS